MMTKQSSLDDVGLDLEGDEGEEDFEDATAATGGGGNGDETDSGNNNSSSDEPGVGDNGGGGMAREDSPRPGTPVTQRGESRVLGSRANALVAYPCRPRVDSAEEVPRSLPWTPKVRQKDLDQFLDYTRRVGQILS